ENGGPEPAVPEGASSAGRAGPLALRKILTAELKTETATDRDVECAVGVAVDLNAKEQIDRLRAEDADAVECPTSGGGRVKPGHVAGGRDATGTRHDQAVKGRPVDRPEGFDAPGVGAVRCVEFHEAMLFVRG